MSDVGDAYDRVVDQYVELFLDELHKQDGYRVMLDRFGELAGSGLVADVGCGPGAVVAYLAERGVDVVGYDVSQGMVDAARRLFPGQRFELGDLGALDVADGSLGGLVSRYSIIHLDVALLPVVFAEWKRVLAPGAPVLVSFFGARTLETHGEAFDHAVTTAHALFPATVGELLEEAGFADLEFEVHSLPAGGRPYDNAAIFTRGG